MYRPNIALQNWSQVKPVVIYFEGKIVIDNYYLRKEGIMPIFVYQVHCFLGYTVVTPLGEYIKDVVA